MGPGIRRDGLCRHPREFLNLRLHPAKIVNSGGKFEHLLKIMNMRKLFFVAGLAVVIASGACAKDIRTVSVTTDPQMHCANCEKKIKNFFRFEKGIKKIETSVTEQRVTITYDADKTSEDKIIDSFSKIDYHAEKKENASGQESAK